MTGVWVDSDGPPVNGLTIHNHRVKHVEQNGVKDGINGDRHVLRHVISEEHNSMFNEDANGKNDTHRDLVQVQAVLHSQQQHPHAPVVHWERFLPLRSLKVLLVENDECTRHVVSALLRNCSYEVTAVANGVDAWKILDNLTNHIDLVLTEVAMPYLSGIGLLSKVMNHKTLKNIPVIMMSSNDSMGIVFKCLSKGAADFLVKPIRKNELKNLWQHVWRKWHNSGGSGSESGIHTQKSTKSKSIEGSDDSSDSNGDNASDNGSGTQGSWSKRAMEVESPRAMLPWDELAEPSKSTCAQVIYSRPEAQSSNWIPTISPREYQDEKDEHENAEMGKDLHIGVARTTDLQLNGPTSVALDGNAGAAKKGQIVNVGSKDENKLMGKLNTTRKNELKDKDSGSAAAVSNKLMDITANDVPADPSNTKEMPSLELSLKQHREVGDSGTMVQQERNVLRHSDQSAFSRYGGTTSTANQQAPTGNVGSCSPVTNNNNNSSEAAKTESIHMPNQRSNGSSNNNDMGSSTNNNLAKPETATTKSAAVNVLSLPDSAAKAALVQSRVMQQQVQVQHHHHHYHHHHHHVHRENVGGDAPNGMLGEGNYASASGSNNGSNGQNESNNAVIGEETNNMDTEDGGGGGGESGSGSRSGVEQTRQAQREAALNKFRQKRKERNFEKKVRYQSRKRLAEQRPRIRGQFVSQSSDKTKAKDSNC